MGERGFSVAQILEWTSGRLVNAEAIGSTLAEIFVNRPAPLAGSQSGDCCFFFSKDYQSEVLSASPGVLITAEPFVAPLQASGLPVWKTSAIIACRDPYFALALLSEKFSAYRASKIFAQTLPSESSVHTSAVVSPLAKVGLGVRIGPHCVIEDGAEIGARSVLYPGVYVGRDVKIGEDCEIFPSVTLYDLTQIGNRVRIHASSVIGADGFGYVPKFEGGVPVEHQKIFHLGRVVISDDVEIGASSMVDRATFGETFIGPKVKIDNHVHVGHNSVLHEGAILCGGVGLAGGTVIGKFAYIGGMAGIGNKAVVGDYAKIGAMSMVDKDVPVNGTSVGNPPRTHRDHFKAHAILNRLVAERDRKKRN